MKFCSRTTHESIACPGVVFVLHKMNEMRRVERELKIAQLRVRVREGSVAIQAGVKLDPKPIDWPEQYAAYEHLIHTEWRPAWIRWGLYSITGLEIDDEPATVDSLLASGPDELVEEIFTAVQKASGLGAEETKNSPSPGGTDSQADGTTTSSTADSASKPDGTPSQVDAIVVSTSPAT